MTTIAALDPALLAVLRCPLCAGELTEREGALACAGCGRSFEVRDGIPLLVHEDLPGAAAKLREAEAWPEKARAEGWYEPDDEVDSALPFPHREIAGFGDLAWVATGHSFQVLLDRYVSELKADGNIHFQRWKGMSPSPRVLEVGAAKCWAAPHWAARGWDYTATDVLVDPCIGLGRGAYYGSFARVQADGEHLPFRDASFDLVYSVATLHHALDLGRMVGELARVVRPGGVVAALNEGTRGLRDSGDAPQQQAERALGINEHVHTPWAYLAAFRKAGLRVRRAERADGYALPGLAGALSRLPKLGTTLGAL
ncbi:MAG: hypothetical protein QOE36_3300, partial [Gaiellaceae bacterium]|nr:hypothetical protein [Gaiellaceae bacterium]